MRLDINLATRPYQDVKRFLVRWATATFVFAVASILFAAFAYHSWSAARGINRQISQTKQQIEDLDKQRAAATKLLSDPQNKDVAENSRFLNQLIARKSFSWTTAFMQLEDKMPPGLHIVSMSPELTASNQLQMTIFVAGGSRDKAIELVRRIEQAPSFKQARLRSEAMLPAPDPKTGDQVQFEISALYVPGKTKNVEEKAPAKTASEKPADVAQSSSAKGGRP